MKRTANPTRLARTYLTYRRRAEVCDYPPTRIWVETTSHCNLHCSFCANRQLSKEQRGFMDFGLFRKLADESAGKVHQFNLFHRGESLLHPDIGRMVGYASERGLRTRIHTNGTVLEPGLGEELIASGLDILSFSFDGYDQAMYESNRPGAGYERVLGNIFAFLATKKRMGATKPFTAIEVMEISNYAPAELERKKQEFLRQFKGLPLDKFVIRRPHNWGGLVEVSAARDPWRLTPGRIPCPLLWHALVVFWDGSILPCPQDFFGMLRLGNAVDQHFMEVWNGSEIRRLRREMAEPKSLKRKPCVDCDRIVRATVAGVPVDYLGRFLSETVFGGRWLGRILPH